MARANSFGVTLKGDKELEAKLRALTGAKLLTVVATAERRAMKPVIAQARQLVRRESGTLARSLGAITKKYPGKAVVITVVGPRTHMGRVVEIDGHPQYRDPVKYSHLIEFGHRVARKGTVLLRRGESIQKAKRRAAGMTDKEGKPNPHRLGTAAGSVPAFPFILPAFKGQQAAIIARYREELAVELEKEAARKAAR